MKDLIKENYFNIDTPFKTKLLIIGLSHLFGFNIIKFTSSSPFNEAQTIAMKRLKKGFFEGMDWYNQARINRGSDPKNVLKDALTKAEKDTKDTEISDQKKYLLDQKIDVLKSLTLN